MPVTPSFTSSVYFLEVDVLGLFRFFVATAILFVGGISFNQPSNESPDKVLLLSGPIELVFKDVEGSLD